MMNVNKYNLSKRIIFVALALIVQISFVSAVADFAVNSFSCTPSEVALNSVFSCTAQIINNGDSSGSVSVATLYPDAGDWLEQASYAQSSGTSVSPGQTTEVSFTGLRATETGSNGFSRILLDDVTDTYVSDSNVEVNIISVVIDVSNSASSTGMNQTFDSSAEVTAGGNIDVTLTFSVDSGGCSIGSQSSTKSIVNMQDGNRQTRSWTVTQGTSGNCRFTISVAATGDAGVATTSDSSSSTVTCTDCPVESSSSSSSSSGGGGGGGGGGGIEAASLGELPNTVTSVSLGQNQFVKFTINNEEHKLKVTNFTASFVSVSIESAPQFFNFTVGDEKKIDLNNDKKDDLIVKLKSINIITNRATFDLTSLKEPAKKSAEAGKDGLLGTGSEGAGNGGVNTDKLIEGLKKGAKSKALWIVIGVILAIVVSYLIIRHAPRKDSIRGKVRIRSGKDILVR